MIHKFEPSKEMMIIKTFISELPFGAYVSYKDIEKATDIEMDNRGKSFLRSACRSLGVEYLCDRGTGIELESPDNSMNIITSRVKQVTTRVKKANKSSNHLILNHAAEMNQEDRNRATAICSLLGATMAFSKGLEQVYKTKKLSTVSQPILGNNPFKNKK